MSARYTVPPGRAAVKKNYPNIFLRQTADVSGDMQRDLMQLKSKIPAHHHGTHEHQIVRVRGSVPSSGTTRKTSKLPRVREFCHE